MSQTERENEFSKRLMATFKVEADEHIKTISSALLTLENEHGEEKKKQALEEIFRLAHSLKGSARAVNLASVETICQSLESIFKEFKNKGVPSQPEVFDILQGALDTIAMIIPGDRPIEIAGVIHELDQVAGGIIAQTGARQTGARRNLNEGRFKQQDEPAAQVPARSKTIRVASDKLEKLLLQAEEMIFLELAANRWLTALKEMVPLFEDWKKKQTAVASMMKTFPGTMDNKGGKWESIYKYCRFIQARGKELEVSVERIVRTMQADHRVCKTIIGTHLEDMRDILMMPASTMTEGFPRMVRDLARQKKKDVQLLLKGGEVEIDKRILEAVKDPLIHLLRNAVDHGVENPAARRRKKKPSTGTIELAVNRKESNRVEFVVSDDGAGIALEKIKKTAVDSGLYTAGEIERLTEQGIRSLIFNPEFSTSSTVDDISGRGLGLAIAAETVEKLGGRISVESEPGKGTAFRILLRVSLATFRGILVESAGRKFIIPTLNVIRVLKVDVHDIKTVENRETIKIGDTIFSFARLGDVLQLPGRPFAEAGPDGCRQVIAVVLEAGNRGIVFQVDDVSYEEEVMVKSLGRQLSRVRNISGATVLGSGEVAPILDAADLVKSAAAAAGRHEKTVPAYGEKHPAGGPAKSILVVEDSITSRMLLKNILESAGYRVHAAVDGMEGWLFLKEKTVDLAILDVDMPGINGFELTEKIRGDRAVNRMPVVLLTGMESRQDRERGIDVGADAYIVKSSFDQGNLLDVIKKLV